MAGRGSVTALVAYRCGFIAAVGDALYHYESISNEAQVPVADGIRGKTCDNYYRKRRTLVFPSSICGNGDMATAMVLSPSGDSIAVVTSDNQIVRCNRQLIRRCSMRPPVCLNLARRFNAPTITCMPHLSHRLQSIGDLRTGAALMTQTGATAPTSSSVSMWTHLSSHGPAVPGIISSQMGTLPRERLSGVSRTTTYEHRLQWDCAVRSVDVAASRAIAVTVGIDTSVRVWNLDACSPEFTKVFPDGPLCVAVHPRYVPYVSNVHVKTCYALQLERHADLLRTVHSCLTVVMK